MLHLWHRNHERNEVEESVGTTTAEIEDRGKCCDNNHRQDKVEDDVVEMRR